MAAREEAGKGGFEIDDEGMAKCDEIVLKAAFRAGLEPSLDEYARSIEELDEAQIRKALDEAALRGLTLPVPGEEEFDIERPCPSIRAHEAHWYLNRHSIPEATRRCLGVK